MAIEGNSDLNLVECGARDSFKVKISGFQVDVINELKLLAPGEEDKRLKRREHYICLPV